MTGAKLSLENDPDIIEKLVIGATFFGSGGGGSPSEAREILEKAFLLNKQMGLSAVGALKSEGVCLTAFGVGSAVSSGDFTAIFKERLRQFEEVLQKPIIGVVPVEIGPKSIATAIYVAALLNLPLIDADIVGGRSSPEVYLETITLFDIPRTPLMVFNTAGDIATLLRSSTYLFEEEFLRGFAKASGGEASVLGYPMTSKSLDLALEHGTISSCHTIGEMLFDGKSARVLSHVSGKSLFVGRISRIVREGTQGFLVAKVYLENEHQKALIYVKNESLLFWVDDKLKVSCPDLISLLDKEGMPLYNGELKEGLVVDVVGIPSLAKWRDPKGLALFNPRTFGFDLDPKLL